MNQGMPAATVPEAIIACINGGWPDEKYQRDQIIFFQGGPADSVYYVQSGRVKVAVVSGEGKEAVVAILLPGSFCGEECLTGHTLRMSTARAFPNAGSSGWQKRASCVRCMRINSSPNCSRPI